MLEYHRIQEGSPLPDLGRGRAFKVILVLEQAVSDEWQTHVSQWLVESGCLYAMVWGQDCGTWDDAIDWADIERFDFEEAPDDKFVMTTWHEDEALEEVFLFSKEWAKHPAVELRDLVVLHVGDRDRRGEFEAMADRV